MYIIAVIVFVLVLVLLLSIMRNIKTLCMTNLKNIEYYIDLNRNYSIYISDTSKPNWKRIIDKDDAYFITDKGKVKKTKIKRYCVVYPSGEILNISHNLLNIPQNAYWIDDNDIQDFKELSESEVILNSQDVLIQIKESKNPQMVYFTTEITNNMNCKLFPIAFGGYIKKDGVYVLDNVINTAYSDVQFINWYNCRNEYLTPGETVSDPNNYGGDDSYWIYIFKTENGDIIKVGKYIDTSL